MVWIQTRIPASIPIWSRNTSKNVITFITTAKFVILPDIDRSSEKPKGNLQYYNISQPLWQRIPCVAYRLTKILQLPCTLKGLHWSWKNGPEGTLHMWARDPRIHGALAKGRPKVFENCLKIFVTKYFQSVSANTTFFNLRSWWKNSRSLCWGHWGKSN